MMTKNTPAHPSPSPAPAPTPQPPPSPAYYYNSTFRGSVEDSTTTATHVNLRFSGSSARSREDRAEGELRANQSREYTEVSSNSFKDDVMVAVANDDRFQTDTPIPVDVRTRSSLSVWTRRWWSSWCQLRPSTTACVTFLLLSTTCSLCSASLCNPQSWWDPYKDKCIPCTVCKGNMITRRPCQVHRDTECGSIYDLKIDWVVLAKTEPNWKEVN